MEGREEALEVVVVRGGEVQGTSMSHSHHITTITTAAAAAASRHPRRRAEPLPDSAKLAC